MRVRSDQQIVERLHHSHNHIVGCMMLAMGYTCRARVASREAAVDTEGNVTCLRLLWAERRKAVLQMNTRVVGSPDIAADSSRSYIAQLTDHTVARLAYDCNPVARANRPAAREVEGE